MTAPLLRIFISSPSDVNPERLAASRVIERLAREFGNFFTIRAELWEQEPLLATAHFQEQIPKPSEAGIVLVIVWSRLGTNLPASRFKGALSEEAVTGTEWEFEDAARAFREQGHPDLLFYRKTARIEVDLADAALVEKRSNEKKKLDGFLHKWFFTENAEFKAAFSQFETTHEFEAVIEQHLRRLLQRRVDALGDAAEAALPARWQGGSPFRGLEPFDVEHSGIFYGRGKARVDLREALSARAAQGSAFVLLLGMSGSGKSSLVRAALIADLSVPGIVENVGLFRYGIMRPSDAPADPALSFARALRANSALPELLTAGWPAERIAQALTGAPNELIDAIKLALRSAGRTVGLLDNADAKVLIVVDQLEELFTTAALRAEDRDRFIDGLQALVVAGDVWVVATMRSDMFHHLTTTPKLAQMAEGAGQYHLLPPQPVEISQMIREPATAAGLRFEVDPKTNIGLDEALHEEMEDDPAALPLLEFTLDELFRLRTPRGVLTYDAYQKLGGLVGALAKRAEDTYATLSPDAQEAFPGIATSLAAPQKNANGFAARRARLTEFRDDAAEMAVVNAFVESRLFVTDVAGSGGSTVRVAHEALFRAWPRLKDILERNLTFLAARDRLSTAADRWIAEGRADDVLLAEGRSLAEAKELLNTRARDLDVTVREFIAASDTAARRRHTRTLRITQMVAAGFAVIALLAGGAGWLAWQSRIAADSSRKTAVTERDGALRSESFFLAALSIKSTKSGDPYSGALLARAALPKSDAVGDRPVVNEAVNALSYALVELGSQVGVIRHSGPVFGRFLDDGSIATIGGKESLRLSRAPDGETVAQYGEASPVNAWISEDSQRVAVQSGEQVDLFTRNGKAIRRIDLAVRRLTAVTVAVDGPMSELAAFYADGSSRFFALPSGKLVATAAAGPPVLLARYATKAKVLVWSEIGGRIMVRTADGKTQALTSVADGINPTSLRLTSTGTWVAAGGRDGAVRLWNMSAPGKPQILGGAKGKIIALDFSATDNVLAWAGEDGVLRVWNMKSMQPGVTIASVQQNSGFDFSPDGRRVAVVGLDNAIRIHSVAAGTLLQTLRGHSAAINSLSFSPDGKLLLSTSADRTARIWQPGRTTGSEVVGGGGVAISALGVDAAGNPFASDADGTIESWGASRSAPLATIRSGQTFLNLVTADSRAGRAAFGTLSGVQLWSFGSGKAPVLMRSMTDVGMVATTIAMNGMGSRALTAGISGNVDLLDLADGHSVGRFTLKSVPIAGFSQNGKVVWVRSGQNIWTRDGVSFATIAHIDAGKPLAHVSIDGAGRSLMSVTGDGDIAVWDARSGKQLHTAKVSAADKALYADSADGARLALIRPDGAVTVIDARTGSVITSKAVDVKDAHSASLSPSGNVLAVEGKDGTVATWLIPSFQPMLKMPSEWTGDRAMLQPFGFSPDGRRFVARWRDTQFRFWPVDASLSALLKRADGQVTRPLTADERAQLILSYN